MAQARTNNGIDIEHMRHALRLAARGLGRVAPNPAVGCVLVKDGHVVGRGWTQPGGRPHAETEALKQAGASAKGATAYVTLEPCAHTGQTPPCADALARAGVARVVIACPDPDPRVNGGGVAKLKAAGIEIVEHVLREEAEFLNRGFLKRIAQGLPLVTLKTAVSADDRVADGSGKTRWITGEAARAHGHLLRAEHDAIMVGVETVLADDPMLDCRLPGMADRSPVRVVLDTKLRLPLASKLAQSARRIPLVVFTAAPEADNLADMGIEIVTLPRGPEGHPDIAAILRALAGRGITRVLAEGGPKVHASLLAAGVVDRAVIYRAPQTFGSGPVSGVALDPARFALLGKDILGPDTVESWAARG